MATLGTRERGALTHPDLHRLDDVNRDVLKMLTTPGKGWWILFGIAAAGVGLFFTAWINQIVNGLASQGSTHPSAGVFTSQPLCFGLV